MAETNAAVIVDAITKDWLGTIGGVLAILGVIAAPITSGDTAFRSARLIVADFLGMEQKTMRRRLYICIPMFLAAIGLLLYSLRDKDVTLHGPIRPCPSLLYGLSQCIWCVQESCIS